jgi:FemAB-related protein (PEP-CTERM system-associated)
MKTFLCANATDGRLWQEFVDAHPQATNYHRWNWKQVIENSFGWPTIYWMAKENGVAQGILPLVWQKSWLFGSFATSLPFLNAGGILANSQAAEQALLGEAIEFVKKVGAQHLELRHREQHPLDLHTKASKVTLVLPVDFDSEKMWKALGTKMRTKVRKSMSFGMTAEFGGLELLDDFYAVFSENMRELGTPVYGRNFFAEILRAFPDDTHICVVRRGPETVAASFLSGFRDRIEAVWSSSVPKYLSLKPNFFLYWNLLRFAGQKGYRLFDFGRSTAGSGTHEFKLQWGAQTIPLYWDYWLPNGADLPEINPQNPKYRLAIWLWQRIPLAVTRKIGPRIVRCLP